MELTNEQKVAFAAVYGAFRERIVQIAVENNVSADVAAGMLLVDVQCKDDAVMENVFYQNQFVAL